MESIHCRFCGESLRHTFANLGMSPLSNAYLKAEDLNRMEPFYPLHAYVCENCYLVQLLEYQTPEQIFSDYAYFSSYSQSWLTHAQTYVDLMMDRFAFDSNALVVEIASNDGYLLQYFKAREVPVLGIEPAENVAQVAANKGTPSLVKFFGVQTARELANEEKQADLLIGNNVLAHVPDINDFVAGMKLILKPQGIITMEFPHVLNLIEKQQFDTIYHEHFSYLSLLAVKRIFEKHGLLIFDVEELPTHGGSLRIYAKHSENTHQTISDHVESLVAKEIEKKLDDVQTYIKASKRVEKIKRSALNFLIQIKNEGKRIAGYGAPAKGNTFLNYCGIGLDFIDYTVDRSPYKQDRFLPGSHIPIYHPDRIAETKPEFVLILPWNLKEEIMAQMDHVHQWGGKFVVFIPDVKVYA